MTSRRGIVLVKAGQPLFDIVLPAGKPSEVMRFAAQELQRYVRQMSGAVLPIRHRRGRASFVRLEIDPGPDRAPASPTELAREDAYFIRTGGRQIHLGGASPRAVLFAVYDFLERLGCGFCVPGEDTVPRRRTISIEGLNVSARPAFSLRSQLDHPFHEAYPVEGNLALIDWLAKNRFNRYHPAGNAWGEPALWYQRRERLAPEIKKRGLQLQIGGHSIHTWLPQEKYFDKRPEWYALIDGCGALLPGQSHRVRQAPAVCVSNAEVQAEVARNINRFFDRCPEIDTVDLWDADVQGYCHCERCMRGVKTRTVDGWRLRNPRTAGYAATFDEEILRTAYAVSYVEFINAVARLVARKHPRKSIGTLVYTFTGVPVPQWCPNLEGNVMLAVAHILRDSYIPMRPAPDLPKSEVNLRFLAIDIAWLQKTNRYVVYEYYHAWTKSGVHPQVNVIAEDMRFFHQLGVHGVENDMGGWSPLNIYAAARLMWDPDRPWEELIRDYCRRRYGAAATAMEHHWLSLERAMRGRLGYIAERNVKRPWTWKQAPAMLKRLEKLAAATRDPAVRRYLQRDMIAWQNRAGRPEDIRFALPELFNRTDGLKT